jgi:hypothetical protein
MKKRETNHLGDIHAADGACGYQHINDDTLFVGAINKSRKGVKWRVRVETKR